MTLSKKTSSNKAKKPKKTYNKPKPQKLNKTFYYNPKALKKLIILNIVLVLLSLKIFYCQSLGLINMPIAISIIFTLSFIALIGAIYVTIKPQRLALITEEGITIDHNELLKWEDIEQAVEFKTHYIYSQHAIALIRKKGVTHNLTFMQKMCQNNEFTPFSIPLYAMKDDDCDEIIKIIKQKVKYKTTI